MFREVELEDLDLERQSLHKVEPEEKWVKNSNFHWDLDSNRRVPMIKRFEVFSLHREMLDTFLNSLDRNTEAYRRAYRSEQMKNSNDFLAIFQLTPIGSVDSSVVFGGFSTLVEVLFEYLAKMSSGETISFWIVTFSFVVEDSSSGGLRSRFFELLPLPMNRRRIAEMVDERFSLDLVFDD